MSGPTSDAVLVNLILDGELESMLREWRRTKWIVDEDYEDGGYVDGPLSYEKIAEEINNRIADIAGKLDAPTRVFHWSAVHAWVNEFYRIGR